MKIDVLTLFPAICEGPFHASMIDRARKAHKVDIQVHQLRNWATGKHKTTDDVPYGGGQGMLMKPEPIFEAVDALRSKDTDNIKSCIILMTPQGQPFKQSTARELLEYDHLIFICGHYEGVDHRVVEGLVDREISIGDYILTNGALAAAVVIDAVVRLIPGVLGDENSATDDSFHDATTLGLEAPQYTRPSEYRGMAVPEVLLKGNHAEIAKWRKEKALERTRKNRPDLL